MRSEFIAKILTGLALVGLQFPLKANDQSLEVADGTKLVAKVPDAH